MHVLELSIDGVRYRCYRTASASDGDDQLETYVVPGIGSVTFALATGVVVSRSCVLPARARELDQLVPFIIEGAQSKEE